MIIEQLFKIKCVPLQHMVLIGNQDFGEIAIELTRSGVEEEELPIRTLDNREQNAIGTCSSDYVRKRKTKKDKD